MIFLLILPLSIAKLWCPGVLVSWCPNISSLEIPQNNEDFTWNQQGHYDFSANITFIYSKTLVSWCPGVLTGFHQKFHRKRTILHGICRDTMIFLLILPLSIAKLWCPGVLTGFHQKFHRIMKILHGTSRDTMIFLLILPLSIAKLWCPGVLVSWCPNRFSLEIPQKTQDFTWNQQGHYDFSANITFIYSKTLVSWCPNMFSFEIPQKTEDFTWNQQGHYDFSANITFIYSKTLVSWCPNMFSFEIH